MLERFKNWFKSTPKNELGDLNYVNAIMDRESGIVNTGGPLNEITYFICLKTLSEAVGKLNIHMYDKDNNKVENNTIVNLLNIRPNESMTPTSFKQIVEFNRNHYGNSYIFIKRDKYGKVESLHPLKSGDVNVLINDVDNGLPKIIYEVKFGTKTRYLKSYEIIHLKGGLGDGIVGKSIRNTLITTFSMAKSSDKFIKKMIDGGLSIKGVINIATDLSKENREKLLINIKDIMDNDSYRDLLPLPYGASLTPLNAKLTDSQFFELKQYTSNQIAAAFGIRPVYLNDYTQSSYANSEAQNLSFYVDTMLSILKQYEEELNYKLLTSKQRESGYHFKFNIAGILRGDLKTQADSIRALVGTGVYTINEGRVKLGMPKIENGDVNLINGTYVKVEDIGKAYDKGGENIDKDNKSNG